MRSDVRKSLTDRQTDRQTDRRVTELIMVPYANLNNYNTGVNLHDTEDRMTVYLKNCCVALLSAKCENPDRDVALVTNIELPQPYADLLSRGGVKVLFAPFDNFSFSGTYTWSLAFYKLCALRYIMEHTAYEKVCYLDTDVYVQGSFSQIFAECDHRILLYDIDHGLQVENYRGFARETAEFLGENVYITHYGGEFFAANRKNALRILTEMERIYERMRKEGIRTHYGDEFILSLAAYACGTAVKNAGAYIFRFWTGTFRIVSGVYENNPVAVLHIPAEKERGMLRLYDRYFARHRLPRKKNVYRIFAFYHMPLRIRVRLLLKRIKNKII